MRFSNLQSYKVDHFLPGESCFNRIKAFLTQVDDEFETKLSGRVCLDEYASKLKLYAYNMFLSFVELDVAHLAFYFDEYSSVLFITSVAVVNHNAGKGLGSALIREVERVAIENNVKLVRLEVDCSSFKLHRFYSRLEYNFSQENGKCFFEKSFY